MNKSNDCKLNGLIEIRVVDWIHVYEHINQKITNKYVKDLVRSEEKVKNLYEFLSVMFRGYAWDRIPWYMKPVVFMFGNAKSSLYHADDWRVFSRYKEKKWYYTHVTPNMHIEDCLNHTQRFIQEKTKKWYQSYRFKKYVRTHEEMEEFFLNKSMFDWNNTRSFRNPLAWSSAPVGYFAEMEPLPCHIESLKNASNSNEKTIWITLENYNSMNRIENEISK